MNSLNYNTVFVHGLTRFFVHRLHRLTQIYLGRKLQINADFSQSVLIRVICGQSSDNWGDSTSESYETRHPSPTGLDTRVLRDSTPASKTNYLTKSNSFA